MSSVVEKEHESHLSYKMSLAAKCVSLHSLHTLYYISRPCRCLLGALSKLARVSFDWTTQFSLDINCFP